MTLVLRSRRAAAAIDPSDGGRLTSLLLDGVELLARGESDTGTPVGWTYGSFPMAPYAGRVKDARFEFAGAEYRLPPNAGPHAGHGLVFDVPWSVDAADARTAALTVDLDGRWPFGGRVEERFDIDDAGITMRLRLINDRIPMPGALGFHPWFRRDLGHGPATLEFEPRLRLAPAADGFPREPSTSMGTRPWDDVFTELASAPTVSWPAGPRLRIHSAAEFWILFERQQAGFCIEPITSPPDSLAEGPVVSPGAPATLEMRIAWD